MGAPFLAGFARSGDFPPLPKVLIRVASVAYAPTGSAFVASNCLNTYCNIPPFA